MRKNRILIYGINYYPELTGIGRYTAEMAEWLVFSPLPRAMARCARQVACAGGAVGCFNDTPAGLGQPMRQDGAVGGLRVDEQDCFVVRGQVSIPS